MMTGANNEEVVSPIAADYLEAESIVMDFDQNGYDELHKCDIYEHENEKYCC